MPRGDEAHGQGQQSRPKQRGAENKSDLTRAETDRGQVGRQKNDSEAVAKSSYAASNIEQRDVDARCAILVERHFTLMAALGSNDRFSCGKITAESHLKSPFGFPSSTIFLQ